jgi:proteasome lid subunit RPN8/RPN11
MIEISRTLLAQISPNDKKPSFQAGYLLGKKEIVDGVQKIVVTDFLNCLSSARGTISFFAPEDIMKIRKRAKEKRNVTVALYRTSPSGSPDFNSLDTKTISDMVNVMPYVIIGGCSEIQISVRDKNYPEYEYGVTVI